MDIAVSLTAGPPLLTLAGRFDGSGAAAFDERASALDVDPAHWVIDMTGVSYLSSLGIRSLVALDKRLKARDGGVVLAGLTPLVHKVLTVSRLDQFLQIVPTPAEAVEKARASTAASPRAQIFLSGCRAAVRRLPDSASTLEWWAPEHSSSRLFDTTAAELGIAFGVGVIGAADTKGQPARFVSTPRFAATVSAESPEVTDFIAGDASQLVPIAISSALSLAGSPTAVVDLEDQLPFSLVTALDELFDRGAALTPEPAAALGFAVLAHAEAPSAGVFATGVVFDAAGAEATIDREGRLRSAAGVVPLPSGRRMAGVAVTLEARPTIDRRLDIHSAFKSDAALETVAALVEPGECPPLSRAVVWVFSPTEMTSGPAKRLEVNVDGGEWRSEWDPIVRRLYQDCRSVTMTPLHGGFMSTTFRAVAYDHEGRRTLPSVVKIGPTALTRREQLANRDYVVPFILNNGTTVLGDAQNGDWAGLRYNFLGVNGPDSRLAWLYDHYLNRPAPEAIALLERLLTQVLKPWYAQPKWEQVSLYRDHTPMRLFPSLIETAEQLLGVSPEDPEFDCPELGIRLPNPFRFLKYEYPERAAESRLWYTAICHGDLNLRNVLVDERDNLYVIDFSETRTRNAVSDFARLEPVLKFEMTRIDSDADVRRLVEFEEGLTRVTALDQPPPFCYAGDDPLVARAHAGITLLRRCADRVTLFERDIVPYWLAMLEWTYSIVCYRQLSVRHKRYAACSAALICRSIQQLESIA